MDHSVKETQLSWNILLLVLTACLLQWVRLCCKAWCKRHSQSKMTNTTQIWKGKKRIAKPFLLGFIYIKDDKRTILLSFILSTTFTLVNKVNTGLFVLAEDSCLPSGLDECLPSCSVLLRKQSTVILFSKNKTFNCFVACYSSWNLMLR